MEGVVVRRGARSGPSGGVPRLSRRRETTIAACERYRGITVSPRLRNLV